jgi:hypothetical protein
LAYNTKAIKKDVDGKPIPQVFNPTLDEYEALKGDEGAARHVIYSPDGQPIGTTGNKLAVRASEVETLLESLDGKDFATQTTLAAILAKLIAAPATEAKQDTLISHVDGVEAALATLLTKAGFDAKADISLTALRDALRGTGSKTLTDLANALVPLATAAKQDTLAGLVSTAANQTALQNLIGTLAAAAVTDPAADGSLIALLKGLLTRLQTLEQKIDGIVDGTAPGYMQLSGRNIVKVFERSIPYSSLNGSMYHASVSGNPTIGPAIDVSKYKEIMLYYKNVGLDAAIQLQGLYWVNVNDIVVTNYIETSSQGEFQLAVNASKMFICNPSATPNYNYLMHPLPALCIKTYYNGTFTTGSLTFAVYGIPN